MCESSLMTKSNRTEPDEVGVWKGAGKAGIKESNRSRKDMRAEVAIRRGTVLKVSTSRKDVTGASAAPTPAGRLCSFSTCP